MRSSASIERPSARQWTDSFEVMRARRIDRTLTLDRHFVIAGFDAVP